LSSPNSKSQQAGAPLAGPPDQVDEAVERAINPHSPAHLGDERAGPQRPDQAILQQGTPTTANPSVHPINSSEICPASAPDPFDLATLRLNPSFTQTAGVKKLLTTVPARRPSPQDFIRVHRAPEYRANFAMIDLKDDREDYLVRPEVRPELEGEVVYKTIFTAINRQGIPFLWPVRLPMPDDRASEWWRSAREAAERAMETWLRVKANQALGAYEMSVATGEMADPVWPSDTFEELLRIAYRDRVITNLDHPVVKRLRGLA
jgi:hypothetical protein